MMFEWLWDFYKDGIFNNDPKDENRYIGYFVESNDLTVEEYQQITGSDQYVTPVK